MRVFRPVSADGELPPRYGEGWMAFFHECIGPRMADATTILDVGSGRRPALAPAVRPPGCHYVGLDVSLEELELAPVGSYDELFCDDLTVERPELVGRFDLIVTWTVLEHVADPGLALARLRSYLSERGRLVALLSGRYSSFALANRLVPDRLGRQIAAYVTQREPETVFPAYYRNCSYDGLTSILSAWSRVEIHPQYRGEIYFRFSRTAHRMYLAYESWTAATQRRNLATHYFVVAEP